MHGAGCINDEDCIPGQSLITRVIFYRRHHHQQGVGLLFPLLGKKCSLRCCPRQGNPEQFKIAIRRNLTPFQPDTVYTLLITQTLDSMIGALQPRQRQTGIQIHLDTDRIDSTHVRIYNRWRDAGCIGYLGCVSCPSTTAESSDRLITIRMTRDIAWGHHQGKANTESTLVVMERLLVFDLDSHRFSRADISHCHSKDIGPFLA